MASMKPMKSIKVANVIALANDFMASSPDSARLDRLHVKDFVRQLLLESRAYVGFDYLRPCDALNADSSRIAFNVHRDLLQS